MIDQSHGHNMPSLGIYGKRNNALSVLYPIGRHASRNAGVSDKTNLKQLRAMRGLSQTSVADLIGTTLNMYGKLERGERRLNMDWLKRLSAALDVAVTEIIADVSEPGNGGGHLPVPSLQALKAALSEHYTAVMGSVMPPEMLDDLAERMLDTVENWKDDPAAARDPQVARSVARQINRRFAR
jgi:transcriptional regulator with XRE-family HTH domain